MIWRLYEKNKHKRGEIGGNIKKNINLWICTEKMYTWPQGHEI